MSKATDYLQLARLRTPYSEHRRLLVELYNGLRGITKQASSSSGCVNQATSAIRHFQKGSSQFQRRVEQACFERWPTMQELRELLEGRRGEAPLAPPYILCNFKLHRAAPLQTDHPGLRMRHDSKFGPPI